jgi:hypothetical protein
MPDVLEIGEAAHRELRSDGSVYRRVVERERARLAEECEQ